MQPYKLIPSVYKSIQISLIIAESCNWSIKSGWGTPETMIGCVKKIQAYIAVSQALPRYGTGLLPTRHH